MAGLVFSDTSTKQGLIQDSETNFNMAYGTISGDSTTLLPTFVRGINKWLHRVISIIFLAEDDWTWDDVSNTTYPVAFRNLVANQQDYKFSTAAWALLGQEGASNASNAAILPLRIQRLDISYDGGSTWRRASPMQVNQYTRATDTTDLKNDFTIANPFYELRSGALWVYPIPTANSTAGLKLFFDRAATEFTAASTTTLPPFDINFHELLSLGASYDYAVIKNLPQAGGIKNRLDERMAEFKLQYGKKDQDIQVNLTSAYSDSYGS